MPRKTTTPAAVTDEEDYITFADGTTMPTPVAQNVPEWMLPMRLRKPPGAAVPIDAPRKGKRPIQRRTA